MMCKIAHGKINFLVPLTMAPLRISFRFYGIGYSYMDVVNPVNIYIFYILSAARSRSTFLSFLRKIVHHAANAAGCVVYRLLLFSAKTESKEIINQSHRRLFLSFELNNIIILIVVYNRDETRPFQFNSPR